MAASLGDAEALISELNTYADWTRASGARMTWTPFYAEPGETVWKDVLAHNKELNESGIRVAPQITAVPITLLLRFDDRSIFNVVTGWEDVLKGFFKESGDGKKARLRDATVRSVMKEGGGDPKNPLTANFDLWTFTLTPSRPELSGLTLNEAAKRDGVHVIDLLCDQIILDDLATLIDIPILNRSKEGVVRFLEDDGTLLGLGDSGAHVMSVTNYRYPTFLLEELVKREESISIELAIGVGDTLSHSGCITRATSWPSLTLPAMSSPNGTVREPAALEYTFPPSLTAMAPSNLLICGFPMKSATNKLDGVLYRSVGAASCCRTPNRMTVILSDNVNASTWS